MRNKGQADGTLPGMVGNGIGDQIDPALQGYLLHNGGLADAGRADHQDGPLPFDRNLICACFILFQIGFDGVDDFLLCLFDIHSNPFNIRSLSDPQGVSSDPHQIFFRSGSFRIRSSLYGDLLMSVLLYGSFLISDPLPADTASGPRRARPYRCGLHLSRRQKRCHRGSAGSDKCRIRP